ncbi:DUF5357 domain-containing protein [Ancylothrix sp. C2]|uniref:DUF5357 domain-containing protein n=1 Tax=Ancylothrix sp. D3o TaxID=2953691 RepID=UPI0021BB520F|nr:DUF5357 domain-containing protein [Ancylothrix sp. D3o]MCT7951622.1 DUF5357 domain-containing protein [Ancylothrix sp. D3o]
MKGILEFIKQVLTRVKPPRPFSWQTLFIISLFSWFMAFMSFLFSQGSNNTYSPFVRELLTLWGWIFLVLSLDWWTVENSTSFANFLLGAWLTGAVVCIFIFGFLFERVSILYEPLPYVCWPIFSATIAVLHRLYPASVKYKSLLDPPKIIILILLHLTISCWLNFHFMIQDWLKEYPSLRGDNFDRSGFVSFVEVNPLSNNAARGENMLNSLGTFLKNAADGEPLAKGQEVFAKLEKELKGNNPQTGEQLTGKPWLEVKKTLLKNQQLTTPDLEEDVFWYIRADRKIGQLEYTLKLQALWRGPSSSAWGYEIEKICRLEEIYRIVTPPAGQKQAQMKQVSVGEVSCSAPELKPKETSPNQLVNSRNVLGD